MAKQQLDFATPIVNLITAIDGNDPAAIAKARADINVAFGTLVELQKKLVDQMNSLNTSVAQLRNGQDPRR